MGKVGLDHRFHALLTIHAHSFLCRELPLVLSSNLLLLPFRAYVVDFLNIKYHFENYHQVGAVIGTFGFGFLKDTPTANAGLQASLINLLHDAINMFYRLAAWFEAQKIS